MQHFKRCPKWGHMPGINMSLKSARNPNVLLDRLQRNQRDSYCIHLTPERNMSVSRFSFLSFNLDESRLAGKKTFSKNWAHDDIKPSFSWFLYPWRHIRKMTSLFLAFILSAFQRLNDKMLGAAGARLRDYTDLGNHGGIRVQYEDPLHSNFHKLHKDLEQLNMEDLREMKRRK